MKMLLTVVVVLLVAVGVYYVVAPYLQPAAPQPTPSQESVKVTTTHVQEDTEIYTIDISYPQFGIPAVDLQIKKTIDDAVAEFKTLPPNPSDSATPKHSFDGAFDSAYVGPDVISVKLILSQYTGGAHPLTLVSGLNYNRVTGEQLLQSDAFVMIGKTVSEVSAIATTELKATLGEGMFLEGADTNPENFSSFVISDDKVTFIFQQYQVAAYAAGVQEVSFDRK